jgi:CheY-like chemotaxis protein
MPKILVIEDNPDIQDSLRDFLETRGFEVRLANNGVIGLQMIKEQVPDLVVSDINMPELDGYQVLRLLRQNSITATIPVIFLTGEVDEVHRRRAMHLGVNDYLTKPARFPKLLRAIATQLVKRNSSQNLQR